MKGNLMIMLVVLSVLLAVNSLANNSEKILPFEIHQYKMENGLNVVTVPFDSPGIASFYIVVRVGARNEVEEGVTGFAHFFEHMMFRGTENFSKQEYQKVLKSIGASANANTSQDRTVYHMTGNAEKLELMFEIESDRFRYLNYSEHDFKTEAGAVKGEYTKNYASPYARIFESMKNKAFDVHTYKHTTMGFFDDIVDMPNQYNYSLEFFSRYYKPEYCTIVTVGDVNPANVNSLADKYFGDWERGSYKSIVPVEPNQTETRYTHLQDGSIPPFLLLNYKGPAFDDSKIDMPALDVLSSIIFSQTSDLYKKLVLEEKKVRFVGGGATDSRDPNLFSIQASLINKEDMQYVRDEITKAIEEVKQNGVDKETLDRVKSNLKYSYAMTIDTPDNIANSLSHFIQLTGDPETVNRLYALYDQVTVEEVKMVAAKYFVPTGLTVATISDLEMGGVK